MSFTAQRWKGRLDAAIGFLSRSGLELYGGDTYLDLLNRMNESYAFSDVDKEAFSTLMAKALNNPDEGDPSDHDLGTMDYNIVISTFPGEEILSRLAEPADYYAQQQKGLEEQRQRAKADRRRNMKIIFPMLGLIILVLIIYNLPYFSEKRAYDRTFENNPEAFEDYMDKYDNPDHLPDVLFRNAKYIMEHGDYKYKSYGYTGTVESEIPSYDYSKEREGIMAFDELFEKFPNHPLTAKGRQTVDSVWDAEIARFDSLHPNAQSSEPLKAIRDMLLYMQKNKVYDVRLNFTSKVDLKDYNDYSSEARQLAETALPELRGITIQSVKEELGSSEVMNVESTLKSQYDKFFNSLFNPGFITVKTDFKENPKGPRAEKLPVIDVDYTIKNQTVNIAGMEFPDIWEQTEGYVASLSHHKNYVLGVDIVINSEIKFPGIAAPLKNNINSTNNEDIHNIGEEGIYQAMLTKCLSKFSEQLFSKFGLKEEQSSEERVVVSEEQTGTY